MLYKELNVYYNEKPERFNRALYVREDIGLRELGCVLLTALRAEFEHLFMFTIREGNTTTDYVSRILMDDPLDNYVCMNDFHLSDLGSTFSFVYDTGDFWDFSCEVSSELKEIDGEKYAYLLDGTGQGIWEDNRYSLTMYLSGLVPPERDYEDDEEGIYLPWNLPAEKFGDFDLPLDMQKETDRFDTTLNTNIQEYLEQDDGYQGYVDMNFDYGEQEVYDPEEAREMMENDDQFLLATLASIIMNQTEHDEVIREVFEELCEEDEPDTAMLKILKVYYNAMRPAVFDETPFDRDEYRRQVRNLIRKNRRS